MKTCRIKNAMIEFLIPYIAYMFIQALTNEAMDCILRNEASRFFFISFFAVFFWHFLCGLLNDVL